MAVGAEHVPGLGALEPDRRRQPLAQRALDGRVRREHRRQQGAQHERDDDGQRHGRRPAPIARAPGEDVRVGGDGGGHCEYLIFGFRYA